MGRRDAKRHSISGAARNPNPQRHAGRLGLRASRFGLHGHCRSSLRQVHPSGCQHGVAFSDSDLIRSFGSRVGLVGRLVFTAPELVTPALFLVDACFLRGYSVRMTKTNTVRQGDVLLVQIQRIPKGTSRITAKNGRLILAEGEATGHHHSIIERDDVALLEIPSQNELFLLVKEGDALLEHQEHHAIAVHQGAYRVVRQREYTPAEIRRVAD